MPGPGGGGHGGGGGRGGAGGGFGGGHHGGGFGGGYHHGGPHMGHHRHYMRRRGGCFGGLFSSFFAIILVIILIIGGAFSFVGSSFSAITQGGVVSYNEETFEDYTDAQYAAEFGSSSAYEDNLLITFLVDEDYYSYYYIAWVGDHIATDINYMLGSNNTELGRAMSSCINESNYKYSLDSNLAQVINTMSNHITALELESSFTCSEEHEQVTSHLTNHSSMSLTEATVNDALTGFTEATGIPVVIVVEDMEDVFGKSIPISAIITALLTVAVVILVIVLVVNAFRRRRNQDGDDAYNGNGRRYSDYDDRY